MKRTIAVDLGASTIDLVSLKPYKAFSVLSSEAGHLSKIIREEFPDADEAVLTGGGSLRIRQFLLPYTKVDELTATAIGGLALSKLSHAVVVSAGTGTAIVLAKKKKAIHLGGTGAGGGTLEGLGKLTVGTADIRKLEEFARTGRSQHVDLTVGDVCGGPIGIVPAEATASNFAKVMYESRSQADVAAALFNLIGQTIGVSASLAAKGAGEKKIVFLGKTVQSQRIRQIIRDTAGIWKCEAVFPNRGEVGTAIGALLYANSKRR